MGNLSQVTGFSAIESIRLSPSEGMCTHLHLPTGTPSLWNDLIGQSLASQVKFSKAWKQSQRRSRSLVFSQITWITICWKVVMGVMGYSSQEWESLFTFAPRLITVRNMQITAQVSRWCHMMQRDSRFKFICTENKWTYLTRFFKA